MDADLFLNAEKESPFSKIPDYVWMVKCDSKTLPVDADFFFNTEEKSPFSKIPGYVWTGP